MAEFTETTDDAIDVSDVVVSSLLAEVALSDAVDVSDEVAIALDVDLILSDAIDVSDELFVAIGIVISDVISVTDDVTVSLLRRQAFADAVSVTDSLRATATYERQASDTVAVSDAIVSAPTVAFYINDARAITATRVRIDFEVPTLINAALTLPSSYRFDNLSPGSVEVVPLSVSLPAGQANPMYVDIETTEHTHDADYEVALTAAIRGSAGQIGSADPFEYTGIGVKPLLQVVIAISATEVEVYFSEAIANNAAANDRTNYVWAGGISTVQVRSVIGNVVTLQTTAQLPGNLYTLTVKGVTPTLTYSIELDLDEVDVDDGDTVLVELFGDYALTVDDEEIEVTDEVSVELETVLAATDSIAVTDSLVALKIAGLVLPAFFASSRIGSPNSPELQRSVDGVNWTSTNYSPAPNKVVRNGARDPATGTIILVGDDGLFLRSTDEGLTWSLLTPWAATADAGALWHGGGKWVAAYADGAGATGIRYSTDDGLTWSTFIDPDSGTGTGHSGTAPAGFSDVIYDGMYAGSQHIGVGYRGNIWTSPDAITWTRRTPAAAYVGSFYGFRGVTYAPALGLYCAVGDPREIQTSPDGTTWTHRTADASVTTFWDVCWSPTLGLFCAVGNGSSGSAKVQTSPDGITWTLQNPGAVPNDLYCCTWDSAHAKFMIGGRFGRVLTSPDGVNWTHTPPANTGGNFTGNSASSMFLIVGNGQGQ